MATTDIKKKETVTYEVLPSAIAKPTRFMWKERRIAIGKTVVINKPRFGPVTWEAVTSQEDLAALYPTHQHLIRKVVS